MSVNLDELDDSNDIVFLLEKHYESTGLRVLKIAAEELRRLYDVLNQEVAKLNSSEAGDAPVRMAVVMKLASRYFGIPVNELISQRRSLKYMAPRHVSIYVAHQLTGLSTPQIGKWFGGRDHTTILHACNRVKDEVAKNNAQFIKYIEELSALCKREARVERDRIEELKRCQLKIPNLSLRTKPSKKPETLTP